MLSFGSTNNTDRWQPIDAGLGKIMKDHMKKLYRVWWNKYVYYIY
jgi:hypothetical protein